jgi:NhaP-type Na+/H+ or K+/H+ antiporter
MTQEEEKQTERRKAEEELRLLYQVSTQDLAFFKKQQWSVTNYVLLLYGALIYVSQKDALQVASLFERFVLCLLATALSVVGILLVYKLEKSIKARRDRLKNIRCTFTESFCLAWNSKHKAPDSAAIAYLLYTVMGLGAVFLWWFVFAKWVITT